MATKTFRYWDDLRADVQDIANTLQTLVRTMNTMHSVRTDMHTAEYDPSESRSTMIQFYEYVDATLDDVITRLTELVALTKEGAPVEVCAAWDPNLSHLIVDLEDALNPGKGLITAIANDGTTPYPSFVPFAAGDKVRITGASNPTIEDIAEYTIDAVDAGYTWIRLTTVLGTTGGAGETNDENVVVAKIYDADGF